MLFLKVFPAPFHYLTVPVTLPPAFADERWDSFKQLVSVNPVITFISTATHKLLHTPSCRLLITLSWHMVAAAVELLSVTTARKTFPFQGSLPRAGVVGLLQQFPSFSQAATQRWIPGGGYPCCIPHLVPPALLCCLIPCPCHLLEQRRTWSRELNSYTDNDIWTGEKRKRHPQARNKTFCRWLRGSPLLLIETP